MESLNLHRQNLKKFGVTMGGVFFAISLIILFRHKHSPLVTSALSFIFFVFGFIKPQLLKPVYIIWMKLAFVLGWVNTRLILMIIFYLVFTPIGLIMRLFGSDLVDRKIDKSRSSYWREKETKGFNPQDYERQF
jgi:hypothetical protein